MCVCLFVCVCVKERGGVSVCVKERGGVSVGMFHLYCPRFNWEWIQNYIGCWLLIERSHDHHMTIILLSHDSQGSTVSQ